jgi:hypothetical protein
MWASFSTSDTVGELLQKFLGIRRGLPPEVAKHFGQ